jgi:hypothetical protein
MRCAMVSMNWGGREAALVWDIESQALKHDPSSFFLSASTDGRYSSIGRR